MTFEIKERDAAGRCVSLRQNMGKSPPKSPAGRINPNKRLRITPREMKQRFDIDILITNSYIIYKNQELKTKALESGVHRLIDFPGSIMTDSGTFQSYVMGMSDSILSKSYGSNEISEAISAPSWMCLGPPIRQRRYPNKKEYRRQ